MRSRLMLSVVATASLAAAMALVANAQSAAPTLGDRLAGTPLAMGRLARDVGDATLLKVLSSEPPVRRDVLAALRAAPYASAPEHLIPVLCRWAASRDPHLAPMAARALVDVSGSLDAADFAAREGALHTLYEARKALTGLMSYTPAPRDDIVFAASEADAALADLVAQLTPH